MQEYHSIKYLANLTQYKEIILEACYGQTRLSGVEVSRDVKIDESQYTEFIKEFKNTYFKEVFDELRKHYKLGRVRLLLKEPRSTLSWGDPEPSLHIPIYTNPGCLWY